VVHPPHRRLKEEEWRRTAARVPAVEEMVRGREAASGWASLTRLQARLGLSSEELKAIVLRLPQLLGESYEATVAPPLEALQARLRLSDPQLRRLVTKLPQLLGLDYDAEVAPKLDALAARSGGASDAELATLLLERPAELLKAGVEVRGSAGAVRRTTGSVQMGLRAAPVAPWVAPRRSGAWMMAEEEEEEEPPLSPQAEAERPPGEEEEDDPPFGGVPIFEVALIVAAVYAYASGDASSS